MANSLSQDCKPQLREFCKIFGQLGRRHEYSQVYYDFLLISIHAFGGDPSYPFRKDRDEAMKRYEPSEHALFNQMFFETLEIFKREVAEDGSWFDLYGNFYEAVASHGKKSAFGQFFTPEHIVDLMTRLTMGEGRSVNDCACGSGRMLLSAASYRPGIYCYGSDLDPVCARMAALNLFLHGCTGEVVCINTLSMQDFRFAYRINPAGQLGIFPLAWKDSHMRNPKKFTEQHEH